MIGGRVHDKTLYLNGAKVVLHLPLRGGELRPARLTQLPLVNLYRLHYDVLKVSFLSFYVVGDLGEPYEREPYERTFGRGSTLFGFVVPLQYTSTL